MYYMEVLNINEENVTNLLTKLKVVFILDTNYF